MPSTMTIEDAVDTNLVAYGTADPASRRTQLDAVWRADGSSSIRRSTVPGSTASTR